MSASPADRDQNAEVAIRETTYKPRPARLERVPRSGAGGWSMSSRALACWSCWVTTAVARKLGLEPLGWLWTAQ